MRMYHSTRERKQFMLGFLYPAVLGAVLYATLGSVLSPALAGIQGGRRLVADTYLIEKGALLVATFFFYLCDYFYVRYTRIYRWSFFIYSCVFLVGLFITLAAIQTTPNAPPNTEIVALVYLAFMVLYLVWDIQACLLDRERGEEWFYRAVFVWEGLSIGLLLLAVRLARGSQGAATLVALLTLIVIGFALVSSAKRVLYLARPGAS